MSWFRLKDSHPTKQKVDQIFQLMDKLGITIEICERNIHIKDKNINKNFRLLDIEDSPNNHGHVIDHFPYTLETKLIYNNDEDE